MLRIVLVTVVLQIEISGAALVEGRKLRGGIYFEEAAAQQQTVPASEWESRKLVRYLGQVDYVLSEATQAPKAKAPAAKTSAPKPPRPRTVTVKAPAKSRRQGS